MQTVTSTDGTVIAYETDGEGPPLVLLHGGSGTRRVWDDLRPHLSEAYTLVVPDRRGRGDSGDAGAYSLDLEVADLRALVDAVDGEPTVFGHSFGGLVALSAAPGIDIDRLVLYEPALLVGRYRGDDLADRMARRLEAAGREAAMALFVEEVGEVDDAQRLDWWPEGARLDLVETVIRENREVEAYDLPSEPAVGAPTLLLTGEHGPDHLRAGVHELDRRLADSRVVELDGVGHVGIQSAAGAVADAVLAGR